MKLTLIRVWLEVVSYLLESAVEVVLVSGVHSVHLFSWHQVGQVMVLQVHLDKLG